MINIITSELIKLDEVTDDVVSFIDILFPLKLVRVKRNIAPVNPLEAATTLDGKGIYFLKIPIVPKIIIDVISIIFDFDVLFILDISPPFIKIKTG